MWRRAITLCAVLGTVPCPAAAEQAPPEFPLVEVLDLSALAHLGRDAFAEALARVLPDLVIDEHFADADGDDPFHWGLGGAFGGPGAVPRPGAIFACARYGLATRDLFAERGFSDGEMFALMRSALPLFDDLAVWPETAVARLHCTFVWDDAETVAILHRDSARQGLSQVFARVAEVEEGTFYTPQRGEDGFRLRGTDGRRDSIIVIESGEVILNPGHEEVSFRAFLLGGGV